MFLFPFVPFREISWLIIDIISSQSRAAESALAPFGRGKIPAVCHVPVKIQNFFEKELRDPVAGFYLHTFLTQIRQKNAEFSAVIRIDRGRRIQKRDAGRECQSGARPEGNKISRRNFEKYTRRYGDAFTGRNINIYIRFQAGKYIPGCRTRSCPNRQSGTRR